MNFAVRNQTTVHLPEQTLILPKFELTEGEIVGIFGPSRARIDLLLRLFGASLPSDGSSLPPLPGHIKQRNSEVDLTTLPIYLGDSQIYQDEQIHKEIGAVFSDPDVNIFGRTVLEDYLNALLAVEAPAEQQIAIASLRHFGLSEKLDRQTEVLSGGEKQRLNCASALVGCRRLFVGDFTSATLDEEFKVFMCKTIKSFAEDGGMAIIGGLDLDDQNLIGISRWFRIAIVNGAAEVIEKTPDLRYQKGRAAESESLKNLLQKRAIGENTILTATSVRRRSITQPLSLSIRSGEIVILIGSNGVGKSTFGQIIVGQIKGKKVEGSFNLAEGIKPVMATQSPSEMLLGLNLYSELPDLSLRKLCGLASKHDEKLDPRGFSYGTQKLIGITNALRLSSGLVILDEPTSGMDFEQKKLFVEMLNHFPNHAILIITHDPSVLVLGRIVELQETRQ